MKKRLSTLFLMLGALGISQKAVAQVTIPRPWNEGFSNTGALPAGFTSLSGTWEQAQTPAIPGNPGAILTTGHSSLLGLPASSAISTPNISGILASDTFSLDFQYIDLMTVAAPPSGVGYFKVFASSNNGTNYTQLDSIMYTGQTGWTTKSYPLASYAGQTLTFKIESNLANPSSNIYVIFDNLAVNGPAAPPCTPPIVNLGNDTAICVGTSLTLDAGNTGAIYLWDNASVGQTRTITTSGQYYVTVTENNCSASDTINVTVNPLPVVNIGNDTSFCEGNSMTLDAGNTGATYLWDNAATTQTRTVSNIGQYYVAVTNAEGCVGRDTMNVDFVPLPSADFTFTNASNGLVNFTASGNNITSYSWNFGDGTTNNSGGATVSNTYDQNGSYTVVLTVKNECGDSVVVTKNVQVSNVVGINDIVKDHSISIYPNPSSGKFIIKNEGNYHFSGLKVTDILGRIHYTQAINKQSGNLMEIDLSTLSKGTYYLSLQSKTGRIIKKISILK